jgi:hypothetical protein
MGNDKDAELEKQVQQYMKDNKCNYSQAVKACMKENKKK